MPTCIHCGLTHERHLTLSLCPDDSGRYFTGNVGYDFSRHPSRDDAEPKRKAKLVDLSVS